MLKFVRRCVFVTVAIGGIFLIGMRRKWPPVLNAVRQTGGAFKPLVLRTAGTERHGARWCATLAGDPVTSTRHRLLRFGHRTGSRSRCHTAPTPTG